MTADKYTDDRRRRQTTGSADFKCVKCGCCCGRKSAFFPHTRREPINSSHRNMMWRADRRVWRRCDELTVLFDLAFVTFKSVCGHFPTVTVATCDWRTKIRIPLTKHNNNTVTWTACKDYAIIWETCWAHNLLCSLCSYLYSIFHILAWHCCCCIKCEWY